MPTAISSAVLRPCITAVNLVMVGRAAGLIVVIQLINNYEI